MEDYRETWDQSMGEALGFCCQHRAWISLVEREGGRKGGRVTEREEGGDRGEKEDEKERHRDRDRERAESIEM